MKDFPWFKNYPAGIPHEINLYDYSSLLEFFDDCKDKYGERIAFENMGHGITYAELDKLSNQFAASLQHLGLQKGDRVAIQIPNLLQFPIAFMGVIKAGFIAVNTNP